tara:strand:+ start:7180 stop:9318 length:2139 start_codon:yes stop_codon:yes gene_type:complete
MVDQYKGIILQRQGPAGGSSADGMEGGASGSGGSGDAPDGLDGGGNNNGGGGGDGGGSNYYNSNSSTSEFVNPYVTGTPQNYYRSNNQNVRDFLNNNYNTFPDFNAMQLAKTEEDYNASKSRFDAGLAQQRRVGSQLDSRLKGLSGYNNEVTNFNKNISNYLGQLRGTYDQLDGIDLNGFENFNYEGPNYMDVSQVFKSKAPTIGNIYDTSGKLVDTSSFDVGALSATDTGELANLYGAVKGQRNTLQNDYDSEVSRNNAFSQDFNSGLNNFNRQFGNADIYGGGVLDRFSDDAYNMRDNLTRYDSELDSFNDTLSGYGTSLDGIDNQLATNQGLYDTENNALESFYQTMNDNYLDREIEFDDMGIADADQIESFDTGISNLVQQLRGFDNKINDDTQQDDYLRRFSGLDDRVDGLRDDRNDELDRIDDYKRLFSSDVRGIRDGLGEASIYDGGALSRYDGRINDARDNVESFRSELTPDFATILANIGLSRDQLTGLQGDRTAGINDIQSELESLLASGQGMELYNEDGLNQTINDINSQGTQLSRFTGSGLDDVRNYLSSSGDAISGRLDDLSDYRGGIETRSQEYLDQLGDMQFYNQGNVDSAYDPFNELSAEQELYGATQARDEVAGIQNFLQGQTDRIASSAESVEARNQAEADSLNGLGVSDDYVNRLFSSGDLTPEEFALLIGKISEKDEGLAQQFQSQYGAQYA